MGTEPLQPLTLICDYDESVFDIVSIDENELKKLKYQQISNGPC